MLRAIFTVSIAAILCVGAVSASAEEAAPDSKAVAKVKVDPLAAKLKVDAARQLYLVGKQQVASKRYEEALKSFQKAYAAEHLAELLFEMAAVYGRMGKMQKAFSMHRRYVDTFKDPLKRLVAAAKFGSIMRRARQDAKAKTAKMAKQ